MVRPGSSKRGKPAKPGAAPAPHGLLENIGLIAIGILILAITITRSWHNIHWSTR